MRELNFRAWNKNFEEMSMVADLDFWGGDVWIVDPDIEKFFVDTPEEIQAEWIKEKEEKE